MDKKNILILGAGFGGLTVLKYLLRDLKKREDIKITLIDKQNYFLFSPLLHELAVGVLFPENIVVPIRNLYRSNIHQFVQARVEDINLSEGKVKTSAGIFSYDYIVLALGGVTDISGMADNIENGSNVFSLKSAEDAVAVKNHIIKMFEKASAETDPAVVEELLTLAISGAGYTGVQLASSLSDVVYKYLLSSYPDIDPARIKINLIESKDRVISELPEKYSHYVMKHLQKHNINVRLNCRITEIGSHRIRLDTGEAIPSRTVVYVTGVVANPVISSIGAEKDAIGRVIVNDFLELVNCGGAYAVGDCVHYQDSVTGQVARQRAHNAVRQAAVVARNLVADITQKKRTKYRISDSAEVISLGRSNALLRLNGFSLSGILAILVWVISYSLLAIGKKNRVKIAVDWVLARIFGPDTSLIESQDIESRLGKDSDLSAVIDNKGS